jgi:hypothetical protein
MTDGDLDAFARQTRAALDREGALSAANTDLRVVLPLLKTLGWAVHGPEVVADHVVAADADASGDAAESSGDTESERETAVDVDEVTVDYALTLDARPAVFVVTAGTDVELSDEHARRLRTAMTAGDVERGLLTNGLSYVFVAADEGALREMQCSLAELPERESVCSLYTRRAARARQRRRRETDRTRAADTLRQRRETTVEAISEALTAGTEGPVADELAAAASDFLDRTIDALGAGDHPGAPGPSTPADGAARGADGRPSPPRGASNAVEPDDADGAGDGDATATGTGTAGDGARTGTHEPETAAASDGGATRQTDPRNEAAPMSRNTGDEEYVVRFFDEHSSVGAVGTDTSAGAVAQVVQYLVEQHALDDCLDLPWSPEDADVVPPSLAVVNREPHHRDDSQMSAPRQIANGYHVETALDTPVAREVVETLAGRSGLRVMFQGAWSTTPP